MRALFSKDIRKLIYGKLDYVDQTMLRLAYNPRHEIKWYTLFTIECAKHGYLDIIKWLLPPSTENVELICRKAIKYGKIAILKWFDYHEFDSKIIKIIVRYNQLEILEYLWDDDHSYIYLLQRYAAKYGNIKMLEWSLVTKGMPVYHKEAIIQQIIYSKQWEILHWMANYDPSLIPIIEELFINQ